MAMLYAQLTHAIGLNDVCDALRLHSGPLSSNLAAALVMQVKSLPFTPVSSLTGSI